MTTKVINAQSANILRPLFGVAAGFAMLVWGVAASFAQSGLIEPSEDALTLPAVVSETDDSSGKFVGLPRRQFLGMFFDVENPPYMFRCFSVVMIYLV
jgi:hypothetical protein